DGALRAFRPGGCAERSFALGGERLLCAGDGVRSLPAVRRLLPSAVSGSAAGDQITDARDRAPPPRRRRPADQHRSRVHRCRQGGPGVHKERRPPDLSRARHLFRAYAALLQRCVSKFRLHICRLSLALYDGLFDRLSYTLSEAVKGKRPASALVDSAWATMINSFPWKYPPMNAASCGKSPPRYAGIYKPGPPPVLSRSPG